MNPHVVDRPRRVAVLGGGISGLASAWHLAGQGHRVELFEASPAFGGLAGQFEHDGLPIERFYHCVMPSDAALLALLGELGMAGDVVWQPVGMGFVVGGRLFPMNTPLDLLRFSPLPFADRLRMGWFALRSRWQGAGPELDEIAVGDWLRGRVGNRLYERLWRPLLEAKLGDSAGGIPALWLASRIVREKSSSQEVKGWLRGGYRGLLDRFAVALRGRGVRLHVGARIETAELASDGVVVTVGGRPQTFDAMVGTLPYPLLRAVARGALREALGPLDLDYQGVVNSVFLTRVPLTKYYWLPVVESGALCQGVVEMSNLVPPQATGGLHVNYFLNYTHRDSELYARSDDELLARHEQDLQRLFPHAAGAVAARYLFRTPHVEPIWPLRFRERRPPVRVVANRVYLAGTAQVYPRINAWDSCCEVAAEMAQAFSADVATGAPRP